jgi:hypothetical protein
MENRNENHAIEEKGQPAASTIASFLAGSPRGLVVGAVNGLM